MTKQSPTLTALRRALEQQRRAERRAEETTRLALLAYIDELEAAGVRNVYAELADVLGCSRQSARERVMRARGDWS